MNINEAKEKAKMFGDLFESEPVEVSKAFIFYMKEQGFDLDDEEEEKLNDDKPLVVVHKDTGKAEVTCFFLLDEAIKLELIKP